jgi:hypothetical protein
LRAAPAFRTFAFAIALTGTATAAPLPPQRPPEFPRLAALHPELPLPPRRPAGAEEPPPRVVDEPSNDAACVRIVNDPNVVAKLLDPILEPMECRVGEPVRLDAVVLDDGRKVPLVPAPVMRCTMAEAAAAHVRNDLAALAVAAGSTLVKVETAAAYECRGRNRVVGAKISEHGHGNAIDIRAVVLADKRVVAVDPKAMSRPLAETWRDRACARFTTVLGPGSDGYHDNHVHLDLAQRRGGHRLCQWTPPPDETVTASAPREPVKPDATVKAAR